MGDETMLLEIAEKLQALPFESLNASQRIFMTIWDFEAEVNNGGFLQYFFNDPGRYAHETSDNLRFIGAKNCALLIDKAIELIKLSDKNWVLDDIRREYVGNVDESMEDEFDKLDSLFFQYPDDLSELMTRFSRSNASKLGI